MRVIGVVECIRVLRKQKSVLLFCASAMPGCVLSYQQDIRRTSACKVVTVDVSCPLDDKQSGRSGDQLPHAAQGWHVTAR